MKLLVVSRLKQSRARSLCW